MNMKHIFSFLAMMLFATSMMAQTGLTCEDPIMVDENYSATITKPCEVWYSAWTYDLPLKVHFIPDNVNSKEGPIVEVDLTCTPGVYADPKVDSLINQVVGSNLSFPVELWCDFTDENGFPEWDLSVNKSYREQLAEFGIPYNIQAFIKVTYTESGKVTLNPDLLFRNCIESSKYINLDDTLNILANDKDSSFVVPYSDWQEDSIRFVWTGTEPVTVYLAVQECSFEASSEDPYVWKTFEVSADAPYKLYSEQMKAAIKNHTGGGIFYGKIVSPTAGKLVVEKIPIPKAQGGAIELEFGKSIQVGANDNTLYCFPKTWTATEFVATNKAALTAYFANDDEFETSSSDANVIDSYAFDVDNGVSSLSLSSKEMRLMTNEAADNYIYVRFVSKEATTITPNAWQVSDCVDESIIINSGERFYVTKGDYMTVFRLYYDDWKGGDLEIAWSASVARLPSYISDTCDYFLSSTSSAVVQYDYIKAKSTQLHDAETVNSWASRVDADGYLYVRFDAGRNGYVTFTSIKPEPEFPDPIYTTLNETRCYGETYDFAGIICTESGTYEKTFTALNGADSIVTLNLTIRQEIKPSTEEVSVRYDALPVLWNDSAFVESTEYTATLQDAYGCDSVVTLKLTVLEKNDIKTTDDLILNLQSAFKVYTMAYADWVEGDVEVNWQGTSPLHVFIAKEEVYNLTPYNRHVLHYEVVPAGEEWVVTKEQMAAWEEYAAAAGGQLYVRFLTEQEGELTTVPVK